MGSKNPVSVVCFGDSNTWGFNPVDRTRYPAAQRWPRQLQHILGPDYYVIEEGLNGRTTVFEDPVAGDKSGLAHLAIVRKTHMPIDLLIIMLGTNDLQTRFGLSTEAIGRAMGRLLYAANQSTDDAEGRPPNVLLVSPAPLGKLAGTPYEAFFSGLESQRQSARLASVYKDQAELYGAAYFDAGSVVSVSPEDAIHLGPDMQAPLAEALAAQVKKMIAPEC
ncbi:MAG: SGNH/GDSL hydrolase family protein [Roseibium sp.]|nr:SGNH/GDSL hydrolase family protein [Roseibium sp.]